MDEQQSLSVYGETEFIGGDGLENSNQSKSDKVYSLIIYRFIRFQFIYSWLIT